MRKLGLLATALGNALLAVGCRGGDSSLGTIFPVSGKITLDNRPLTAQSTVVLFKPDAAKGNTSSLEPAGTVNPRGSYTLLTKGRKGAPPGWYRVAVTATELGSDKPTGPRHRRPVPRSLVPSKYGQASTTDLMIEVVENPRPGAYDLRLSR